MSEAWAYVGGILLAAATVPQAARLIRTRTARDFDWPFVVLNLVGITILGLRALEIGEWAFVAVNATTAAFWGLAAVVKASEELAPVRQLLDSGSGTRSAPTRHHAEAAASTPAPTPGPMTAPPPMTAAPVPNGPAELAEPRSWLLRR